MSIYPRLASALSTPKIIWHQTDVSVNLRIILVDVKHYFLFVDRDHVRFSTIIDQKEYYACVYLFGAVIPEKTTHSNLGREIRVTIPKAHKWTMWPRLCIHRDRNRQIIHDPDKVDKQTFEPKIYREVENWADYIRRNDLTIMPAAASSDEADSEDEMNDALFDEM